MGKNEAGETELDWSRCVGWGGAASIVAMRKQSNTNWSHSRGTAGAHRGDSLGGPAARKGGEKEGGTKYAEKFCARDGDIENRSY